MNYPIKLKASHQFIRQLGLAENGRYEDALGAREEGNEDLIKANNYDCVLCDFIDRHKTVIEVRDDQELCELYYALASGVIGPRGHTKAANSLLDKIRDRVREIDPNLVRVWPCQTGL